MSHLDDPLVNKSKGLITLALLNAYGQSFLAVGVIFFAVASGVSGAVLPPPSVAGNGSFFLFVGNNFMEFLCVGPVFSLALIPAWMSKKWKVVSLIAMLINFGTMLLLALTVERGLLLPAAGYLVSIWLVKRALLEHKNKTDNS